MELARWFNQVPFGRPIREWTYEQRRVTVLYLNNMVEKQDAQKASNSTGVSWTGNFGTVRPDLRK